MDQDEVVISGVGGHFPECDNLAEFRDALFEEKDILTDNAERWKPGRLGMCSKIGKVSGIDRFDAVFFGMHRKLTDATDPMSRIIMERVFEAIVDAGFNPVELRGTRTAVYIASALSESENIFIQTTAEDGFGIMGHNRSMMANRVSYYFDFKGPSFALDSSFNSGLSVLDLGKRAIDTGECDMAIVGCATLSFHPEISQHFHDRGYLSAKGFTKPFDKDAEGWVRSEATVCMLLQRKEAARRVYASILHVKVKEFAEDHKAPLLELNPRSYARLLNEFYSEVHERTGITPDDIDYLEAEGGGYKAWDELEVAAVDEALCSRRSQPLLIGSTKGTVGQTEASSGLVSVCKVLVAMETGTMPATVGYHEVNPALRAVVEGRLQVVAEKTPFQGSLVALNNFGLTNMFGHALLKANPRTKAPLPAPPTAEVAAAEGAEDDSSFDKPMPIMVCASARNEDALKLALDKLNAMPAADPEFARLMHDVYISHIFGHLQRGYTFLPKTDDLPYEFAPHGGSRRPIWFVYSGMGSQWVGMARHLLRVPVFRAAIEKCHRVLEPHGVDLMHIITTKDNSIFDNILHSFVGIAAVQIGLTDVLTALGIKPDGIIGHSVGELGCAYADGCFTAEQMVLAAHARGRASIETELIRGTMAAVGLGYQQVKSMVPETIEVACHNSNTSSTISGPAEDMQRFVAQLKSKDIFAKAVNVSNIAYHSRYIAPAGPKLLALLREVVKEPKPRSERWVSTSVPEERWGEPVALTSSAEYHTNNLLSAVYFEEGSRKIPKDAICIEIAPHGLLQAILKRSLDAGVTNIPLTRRDAPDGAVYLLQAIGKMYLSGLNPQLQNLYDPVEYPVSRGTPQLTPLIAWDHSEVWYTGRYCQQKEMTPGERHLPVRSIDPVYAPYRLYKFQGRSIITPAICLEKVMKMVLKIYDEEVPVVFENVQFYRILEMPTDEAALVYVLYQRGSGQFEVSLNMNIMARGRAYVPSEGLKKMWVQQPPTLDEGPVILTQDEVYEELDRHGLSVDGKLKGIKQILVSTSNVQGRVAYHGSRMLLLDTLLQLQTLVDSEEHDELRVPHRVRQIILDPCKSWVSTKMPEDAQDGDVPEQVPEQLEELVFRLHRPACTLRCAGMELRGVTTRRFKLPVDQSPLALDLEQFTAYGDKPALLERAEELVSAAVQLAVQQVALQPLCRSNTETVVGILSDGFVNGLDVGALENLLQSVGSRNGSVVVRWVTSHEAAECDLLVADDADQAGRLLAPHAVLLAVQSPQQPLPGGPELRVLLQQTFGPQRLVLLKKVQPDLPSQVVEVGGVLSEVNLVPKRLTYLVWRSVPEQGIPSLMKEVVRVLSGAHRARCVFLLDPAAPAFSPTHPLYAAQARLGLAASVFLNGSWGNLFHYPRHLQALEHNQPERTLPPAHRLENIPDVEVNFLGLNGAGVEPSNLEEREGHILDIRWPKEERELKGIGLLDYAGTRRSDKEAVMGILDSETLDVDPILAWNIPSGWSKEDAATTPYAYAMAYYALVHTAQLQPGETVLVHDGWSAIGQAALNVALAVGGVIYTTYRTEEERGLIAQRYPQIPAAHILPLQGEQFEKHLVRMQLEDGESANHLMRVVLSNLRGEGLWASLRLFTFGGRFVQLNTQDPTEGVRMGMSIFIKSTGFYGLSSSCLLRLRADEKQSLHAQVQEGLRAGVVRPLDRTVLPASHAKQAVSYLDGQCTGKLLLELKATAPVVSDGGRFLCQEHASYLVVGGDRSHALHTVDWLLSRGARIVLLAGQGQAALGQGTLRRLALMRARWGAHVTTVPSVRADTAQGAATLVTRAANMAPLAAVFVLPTFGTRQEEVLLALDAVLRSSGAAPGAGREAGREAVLLVAVEAGAHSERVVAACAARRRAGGRAVLVSLNVDAPYLRALAMDNALVKPEPVQHVKLRPVNLHQASLKERLGELLPMTEEGLMSLGRAALTRADRTTSTLLASAFGGTLVKSREVPPCFLLAGLTTSPTSEMRPLAQLLLANAVLMVPGGAPDVEGMAADVVREMVRQQPAGPYTVVARGWAGCLAIQIAHLLESGRGTGNPERVAVMLLDCAPQHVQEAVRDLGQGVALQSWVLCSLLHLSPLAYDEVDSLPTWPSRLERALQLAEDLSEPCGDSRAARAAKLEVKRAAIDLVYSRLQALADYKTDFQLNKTVITLIRPPGSEADNFCGLEKVSTYPVQTSVSTHAVGTPQFWQEAARVVSQGVYIGSKPMHLQMEGMTLNSDMLWQRLR